MIVRIIPFFLSAVLFLSGFFTVFAPLPILVLWFSANPTLVLWTLTTNAALVALLSGMDGLGLYLLFGALIALGLGFFLRKKNSLERSSVQTLFLITLAGIGVISVLALQVHQSPIVYLETILSQTLQHLHQRYPDTVWMSLFGELKPQDVRLSFWMVILNSMAFTLVVISVNLVILLRINPGNVRESLGLSPQVFVNWRAPPWMIWPTLALGFATVLVPHEIIQDISMGLLQLFLLAYLIQGICILNFFFNLWNIQGIFRILGYFFALMVLWPLVLGLGVFDLWLDFRTKFSQS